MKRILIIGPKIYRADNANAIIIEKLIHELKQVYNYEIDYIAINQTKEFFNGDISNQYQIEQTFFSKHYNALKNKTGLKYRTLAMILVSFRRIFQVLRINRYPDVDPTQSKKAIKLANELHNSTSYNCVISVFRPFTSIVALSDLKEKNPDLLTIVLYLDLLKGGNQPDIVSKLRLERKLSEREDNILKKFDAVFLPSNSKQSYSKFIKMSDNTHLYEFPTFDLNEYSVSNEDYLSCGISQEKERINFLYAGVIDRKYRNPLSMLNYLNRFAEEGNPIQLDICGSSNCIDIFNSFDYNENFEIKIHGQVSELQISRFQIDADVLINISNKHLNMIPSKIFKLFSSGKPILNFYYEATDPSLEYFYKYPLSENILEGHCDKFDLLNLIKVGETPLVSQEYLLETYRKHTILYFANQFSEVIEGL